MVPSSGTAPGGAEVERDDVVALLVLLADAGRHLDRHAEANRFGRRLDVNQVAAHRHALGQIDDADDVRHRHAGKRLVDDRVDPDGPGARQRDLGERTATAALAARDAVAQVGGAARQTALADEIGLAPVFGEPQKRDDRAAAGRCRSLGHTVEVTPPRGPCPTGWTGRARLPYAASMADPFQDRVALVTGGGSGIGAAMAAAFAARGARLVLADIDPDALARTGAALRERGADVLEVRTDVGELAQVRALADAAVARFGAVHVVCNNAGVAVFGQMVDATHADWEYAMRVNFWGVV